MAWIELEDNFMFLKRFREQATTCNHEDDGQKK